MIAAVTPTGPLDAVVSSVPGSKSIANRVLVFAALAEGRTVLHNVPDGDDTAAMLHCIGCLGAAVEPAALRVDDSSVGLDVASTIRIVGTGGRLATGPMVLPTRLAGTTSRFVTALCALGDGVYTVDGEPPLRARPMGPLHDALSDLGAGVEPLGPAGHLPVVVRGARRQAAASVTIRGDVSSQYISALMMIAPYLADGLQIRLSTPLVSRPYVEITAAVMAVFGVVDIEVGDDLISVGPGRYAAREYVIEADASSASYPLAAAAVAGGSVTVEGLGESSLQGDARFADVLGAMGCTVERTGTSTRVTRSGSLHGVEVDMADISDTVPTLAVVAAFASSPTWITGVGFIRRKESDRIGDLVAELRRLGVDASEEPDGLVVRPSSPRGARVGTHHDHRLAMGLALIGLAVPGVEIEDAEVVSKSWPAYWGMLHGLGPAGR